MSQIAVAEVQNQEQTSKASASGTLQRKCDKCRKKKPVLQRSAVGSPPEMVPLMGNDELRSPEAPDATSAFMEPRFGQDFSQIPVHSRSRASIQAKLKVNAPGDLYEQEADRIADQVLAMSVHAVTGAPPHIQRFSGQLSGQAEAAPASVDHALASPGSPLEPALRQDMEPRFGQDFSRVRVHSDVHAEQSAQDVMANAYTVGHNIVFGAGQYAPDTNAGRRLIVHELTHVVQGAGSIGRKADSTRLQLVMRQPTKKDQTAPPADTDPCTAPDAQLPAYAKTEEKQRHAILKDMLRGVTADEEKAWCKRLRRALAAFSTSQMRTMKAAGVRFWRSGEFPPPFKGEYAPSKTRRSEMARYEYRYRIIQWGPKGGVDEIRHELAHAWDHVRGGKVPRLDSYKGASLKKAIFAPVAFTSETAKKLVTIEETVGADKKKVSLSIQDTYDRFMKRPVQSYWSFANSMTAPEHVTNDVREFYAEGYSVFHGDDEDAQAKLLCDAPELYQLLEKEANDVKLAVPDRGKLVANNKTNNRKCV
jgi:hypothetical protein